MQHPSGRGAVVTGAASPVARSMASMTAAQPDGREQAPVRASWRSQARKSAKVILVVGCCHRPRAVLWFGGDGGGRAAGAHGVSAVRSSS